MTFRIDKTGITFSYNNDELTWLWWWVRSSGEKYLSLIYGLSFPSLKAYWMNAGASDKPLSISKIQGYEIRDLIHAWVRYNCRKGTYLLLYDINVEAKPASFWRSIPDRDKKHLLSDVVLLVCKDVKSAQELHQSIPENFARCGIIHDGAMYLI